MSNSAELELYPRIKLDMKLICPKKSRYVYLSEDLFQRYAPDLATPRFFVPPVYVPKDDVVVKSLGEEPPVYLPNGELLCSHCEVYFRYLEFIPEEKDADADDVVDKGSMDYKVRRLMEKIKRGRNILLNVLGTLKLRVMGYPYQFRGSVPPNEDADVLISQLSSAAPGYWARSRLFPPVISLVDLPSGRFVKTELHALFSCFGKIRKLELVDNGQNTTVMLQYWAFKGFSLALNTLCVCSLKKEGSGYADFKVGLTIPSDMVGLSGALSPFLSTANSLTLQREQLSLKCCVERLEKTSISCKGPERLLLLKKWLTLLIKVKEALGDDVTQLQSELGCYMTEDNILEHPMGVFYYSDGESKARNFRDVLLHSEALEGVVYSMVIGEMPSALEVHLLLRIIGLCLSADEEVFGLIIHRIELIARERFNGRDNAVLVQRETLIPFARSVISGLAATRVLLRDGNAASFKVEGKRASLYHKFVLAVDNTISRRLMRAWHELILSVILVHYLERLLWRKKESLLNEGRPESHAQKELEVELSTLLDTCTTLDTCAAKAVAIGKWIVFLFDTWAVQYAFEDSKKFAKCNVGYMFHALELKKFLRFKVKAGIINELLEGNEYPEVFKAWHLGSAKSLYIKDITQEYMDTMNQLGRKKMADGRSHGILSLRN